jgi:NAD(P)-dependent dehydrogenase (short-subunit alcohol dehydrogenase family)
MPRTQPTPAGLRSAEDRIAAIRRLDLLVNNAGYGPFAGLDAAVAAAPIGVHVIAPTRLSRAALPGRDRGAATNSAASWPVLSASWTTEVLDEKPLTSTTR